MKTAIKPVPKELVRPYTGTWVVDSDQAQFWVFLPLSQEVGKLIEAIAKQENLEIPAAIERAIKSASQSTELSTDLSYNTSRKDIAIKPTKTASTTDVRQSIAKTARYNQLQESIQADKLIQAQAIENSTKDRQTRLVEAAIKTISLHTEAEKGNRKGNTYHTDKPIPLENGNQESKKTQELIAPNFLDSSLSHSMDEAYQKLDYLDFQKEAEIKQLKVTEHSITLGSSPGGHSKTHSAKEQMDLEANTKQAISLQPAEVIETEIDFSNEEIQEAAIALNNVANWDELKAIGSQFKARLGDRGLRLMNKGFNSLGYYEKQRLHCLKPLERLLSDCVNQGRIIKFDLKMANPSERDLNCFTVTLLDNTEQLYFKNSTAKALVAEFLIGSPPKRK